MVLVDGEIGDGSLQVQRRRDGQVGGADVQLHAAVVGLGQVADLLSLGDAAAGAQVRLGQLQCAALQHGQELPAVIQPLAMGQGQAGLPGDVPGDLAGGVAGLLVGKGVILFKPLGHLQGGGGVGLPVVLDEDVDVRSHRLANRRHPALHSVQHLGGLQAAHAHKAHAHALLVGLGQVELEGGVPLLHGAQRVLRKFLRGAHPRPAVALLAPLAPVELQLGSVGA